MNEYLDIVVLPDPEFKETVLMSALFSKLHRGLVAVNHGKIGVSFPKVDKTLGNTLRLHGSETDLNELMTLNWQKGLTDYTEIMGTRTVPKNCQHRVVTRLNPKLNIERLYRRSIKKGWLTEEEALERMSKQKRKKTNKPFVQMNSSSTGQKFKLYIEHQSLQNMPMKGKFSSYGLSKVATVPWF